MYSDDVPFFLAGLALLAFAGGLVYVSWLRPRSRLRPLLRAWRYGTPMSVLGAATVVGMMVPLGVVLLLTASQLPPARWGFTGFMVAVPFVLLSWIADIGDDDGS
jgi:hypothetical protein